MRKMFALICVATAFSVSAQAQKSELDYYQSIFGMGKKAVMSELIQLKPGQEDAFWALYDQYEASRKAIGKDRIGLLAAYADNFDNMDQEKLNAVIKESIRVMDKNEKLINAYYKKVSKKVGPVVAAQFYQGEWYLLSKIRVAIFGNIPMVEKLQEKK